MQKKQNERKGFTYMQKTALSVCMVLVVAGLWLLVVARGSTTFNTTIRALDTGESINIANGLVAHYTFDGPALDLSQASAEVRDVSSFGKHGNWLNHASTTVEGVVGQALLFDGSNDRVAVGNHGSTVKAVSFWMRNNGITVGTPVIALNGATAGIGLGIEPAFGTAGVVSTTSTVGVPRAIATDGTNLYVAGGFGTNWRIEKRLASDGSLVSGFGTHGAVLASNPYTTPESIVEDGTHLYIVGHKTNLMLDSYWWYIEKRLMSDGSLVSGFGTSGAVTGDAASDYAYSVTDDGTNLYIAGVNSSNNWRIEKRLMSDGSLVSGFGSSGVVTGGGTTRVATTITNDGTYLYITGTGTTGDGDGRIEKRLMSDGSLVSGFGSSGAVSIDLSYEDAVLDSIHDGTYLYCVGYTLPGISRLWFIQKRLMSDGSLVSGFGTGGSITSDDSSDGIVYLSITQDGTHLYYAGNSESTNWTIKKRLLADGSLDTGGEKSITTNGFSSPTTYIDGALGTSLPQDGWHHVVINDPTGATASNLFLGSDGTSHFQGVLDDVRLFSRELSEAEVRRLYQIGATTELNATLVGGTPGGLIDLERGLRVHYPFDGSAINLSTSSAEVRDVSGSNLHGNWRNHASTTVSGVIGQALLLDGTDDRVDIASDTFDSVTEGTIMVWGKLGSDPEGDTFASMFDAGGGTRHVELGLETFGSPSFEMWVTNDADGPAEMRLQVARSTAELQSWHHYAYVVDATGHRVYIDGVLQTPTYLNGAASDAIFLDEMDAGVGTQYQVGTTVGNNSEYFAGALDDFRIYDRALSPDEVRRAFELGSTAKINTTRGGGETGGRIDLSRGLVGHWTFDGPSIDSASTTRFALDSSSSGLHSYSSSTFLTGLTPGVHYADRRDPKLTIGRLGQGVQFNGTTSLVSIEDPGSNSVLDFGAGDSITLAAWVFPTTLEGSNWISVITKGENAFDATPNYQFQLRDGGSDPNKFSFYYSTAPSTYYGARTNDNHLVVNEWQHVAITFTYGSGINPVFYYNGVPVASNVDAGFSTNTPVEHDLDLWLGAQHVSDGDPPSLRSVLNGGLDDVRIYNRALSAEEVKRLYDLGG